MLFTQLTKIIPSTLTGGQGDPDVVGVSYDSRAIMPGFVYVAISGIKADGDAFIGDAIARGAVAVVSSKLHPEITVPWCVVKNPRSAVGIIGKSLWNISIDKIKTAAVTGTNGKTTTAYLLWHLMRTMVGADKAWMFGTIEYALGNSIVPSHHTTPESVDIFAQIHAATTLPSAIAMEVSSHSLALDRISGLEFDVGIWTNLTQDHLDFHKTMEEYYQAKKLLFMQYLKADGVAVINSDDAYGKRCAAEISGHRVFTYGKEPGCTVRIVSSTCTWGGTTVDLEYSGKTVRYESKLRGCFNVYNLSASIAAAYALGASSDQIGLALAACVLIPGRMDRVNIDAGFSVVVDYAHTPDALVNILKTARDITPGRLICVFGCGGDRDKTKRPIMATAVAAHCDEAVVTSDNPRSEKPYKIIEDVLRGMPLDFPHVTIGDRREAIKKALSLAKIGDCVVIAGKGHEDYQEIAGIKHPFDDKKVVVELYADMVGAQK